MTRETFLAGMLAEGLEGEKNADAFARVANALLFEDQEQTAAWVEAQADHIDIDLAPPLNKPELAAILKPAMQRAIKEFAADVAAYIRSRNPDARDITLIT